MRRKNHLAVLLAFTLFAQAHAQQPAAAPPPQQRPAAETPAAAGDEDEAVRITTNLVQLDFVVTDRQGRQVTDLTADDLEIFEDGRPQKITNFSYISTAPPEAADAAAPAAGAAGAAAPPAGPVRREGVRRTIAVVVDDLGMSFQALAPARKALRRFVEQQVRPGDLVAIIRTGGEVGSLQQFTNDRRQLLAAVERLRWNPCSRRGIYLTPPVRQDTLSHRMTGGRSFSTEGDMMPVCSNLTLSATLEALRFIVAGMRELPGRKSVILLSDSIPLAETEPAAGGVAAPFAGLGSGTLPGGAGAQAPPAPPVIPNVDRRSYVDPLRSISELAVRASVVIYSVDTRGLPALGASAADDLGGLSPEQVGGVLNARGDDMLAGREGTESLAQQTGGFVVRNNNDVSHGLRRIMDDLRGYYLVGYRPGGETFDRRFHRIKARLRNRPGLSVRARAGFYGVREEDSRPKSLTAADRLNLALTSPFAAGDIDVQLTPVFTNLPARGSFLRTMLHIDARRLTFRPEAGGWQGADVVLRGVLFGDNGKIAEEHSHSFTMRLRGATLRRVQERGFDYVFNMPVRKPGAYQFRVAVADTASGRVGSAGQFVDVPDVKKDRLALSGLVVRGGTEAEAGATAAQTQAVADGADGAAPAQDTEATPALRRFRQQALLDYTYLVFNARADKAAGAPRLTARTQLFRDGRPVFDGEAPVQIVQQIDPTRAVAAGRLHLGNELAPGEYVLQVTVTDPLAAKERGKATQWIDFEIVR